uniref:Putative phage repressor n=1 Tax=Magnetococcus massalia (strain MO-1) TaxID=451514 RepID=A0A1S7LKV9_MAGMO|nr:Putative phage repressor [Candidatus Magnetococcus massalia]
MHEALAERMRQCASRAGSGDALARLSGIPRRTIETYLTGQSEPKTSRLVAIAEAAGVSVAWLASGTGGPDPAPPAESESMEEGEYTLVPRYDVEASAGFGSAIEDDTILEHLAFKTSWIRGEMGLNPHQLALINVHGDSMEPTLRGSDLLLIDLRRAEVRDDAIYVLRFEAHLLVKRAQRLLDASIIIRSDNPAYKEQVATPEQAQHLCVIGKVVWVGRRI